MFRLFYSLYLISCGEKDFITYTKGILDIILQEPAVNKSLYFKYYNNNFRTVIEREYVNSKDYPLMFEYHEKIMNNIDPDTQELIVQLDYRRRHLMSFTEVVPETLDELVDVRN